MKNKIIVSKLLSNNNNTRWECREEFFKAIILNYDQIIYSKKDICENVDKNNENHYHNKKK